MPPPAGLQPRRDVLALLRACKLRPEDTGLRLVLADWLEENGDEAERALAEVARLGCQRWQAPGPEDRLRQVPGGREAELIARHRAAWFRRPVEIGRSWGVDRGLFEVRCLAAELAEGSAPTPALREGWGWVHHLVVIDGGRDVGALAASPVLGQVGWLNLGGAVFPPRSCRQLAASPHISGLTGLVMEGCQIGHRGLTDLLRSPHWGDLTHLDLASNQLDERALDDLLGWGGVGQVRSLSLASSPIGDAGLRRLAHSTDLAGLEALNLDSCLFGPEGVRELSRSAGLRSLRRLWLRPAHDTAGWLASEWWSNAHLMPLLEAPFLRGLQELYLPPLRGADTFLKRLAERPEAASLRVLDLGGGELSAVTTHPGLSGHLSGLRYLRVEKREGAMLGQVGGAEPG